MACSSHISARAAKAAVAASVALCALTGSAQAATKFGQTTKTVKPGGIVRVTVLAGAANTCKLTAGKTTRTVKMGASTRVRFSFKTAKSVRPGKYPVIATCAASKTSYKLTVKRTRTRATRRTLVAGKIRALVLGAPTTFPRPAESDDLPEMAAPARVTPESPEVTEIWNKEKGTFIANGTGQCTDWVSRKRPDVIERAERIHIAAWINAGRPDPGYMSLPWYAGHWAQNAAEAGMTVNTTPAVGAVMAKPGKPGHVAYVEEVFPDGSFKVSEMNAPEEGVVTTRTVTPAEISADGLQFIH